MAPIARNRVKSPQDENAVDGFPGQRILAGFCHDHHLTPRERQILTMICRGLKNTAIAGELNITDATIRLHIGNIHRKLNTSSKVDLVLRVWKWSSRAGMKGAL